LVLIRAAFDARRRVASSPMQRLRHVRVLPVIPRSALQENIVTTPLRIASIAGTLALALSTAAGAATIRLVPVSAPSVGASVTCAAAPASITDAQPADVPTIAAEQNVTGITSVRIALDASGRLTATSVLESSGNRWLDLAALQAARSSSYRAESRDCTRVSGTYALVVDFTK
jgi:TonB family protein